MKNQPDNIEVNSSISESDSDREKVPEGNNYKRLRVDTDSEKENSPITKV